MDRLRMKVRMLLGRGAEGARLDEELQFHLEQQIAENRAAGMSAEEARYAAIRTFGNPLLLREQTRGTWNWDLMESLLREVRYGARTLARAPGFACIAIVVMALGIGANVALFAVVRSVLLQPLPYQDPGRLIALYENTSDQFLFNSIAGGVFAEWQKHNNTFSQLALFDDEGFNLTSADGQLPEKVHGLNCTWNLLSTLGVRPALGRDFTAADDQRSAAATAMISWSLWQRRFGGNRSILNESIHLNGRIYRVIGVLPAWFGFPDTETQILTPIYHDRPPEVMTPISNHNYEAVGRLRPGVTEAQGRADLSLITHRLHVEHLDDPFVSRAANTKPLLDSMVGEIRKPLLMLLAATGCVLLIACLNVANLLIARGVKRRKEFAIRAALGGGRLQLLRERLLETLLLTAAGGAAGLGLAYGAIDWLATTRKDISRIDGVHIDGTVLAFTLGIIVLCAVVAGLVSFFGVRDRELATVLQDSTRGSSAGRASARLRMVLLAGEVGLTVVLLVAAGLLLKSYQHLRSSNLGCLTDNVLTMRIDLFGGHYREQAQQVNFYRALLERVRALPGVEGAGFTRALPGQGYWGDRSFEVVGHAPLPQGVMQFAINREADPGYFAAMGIPILEGSSFDPNRQLKNANQVVISESFAQQYFPNEDPIGKHLRSDGQIWEICGVVGDVRYRLSQPPKPIQYYSLYAGTLNSGVLVIRSAHNVEQLAVPVQRIVQELDRDLPVSDVQTMDQMLGKSAIDQSFDATLLTGFGALSLLLAAAGLFGVLSYLAAQRSSEIAIRIALGARRDQVLGKMLFDGLKPALFGLLFGLAGSVGGTHLLGSMLFDTKPLDPAVFAGVAGMLLVVAAVACVVPAWRASRMDPMQALRTE